MLRCCEIFEIMFFTIGIFETIHAFITPEVTLALLIYKEKIIKQNIIRISLKNSFLQLKNFSF